MKIRLSILLLLITSCSRALGQNMIDNGNFENFPYDTSEVFKDDTRELENWGDFGRVHLHQHAYCGGRPYEGIHYIDLRLYSKHVKNYREYAEAKITCPLIKGHQYIISLRTRPIKGIYRVGDIGIYLAKDSVNISSRRSLPFIPQIVSAKNKVIDDTDSYTLVADTITATGGEQYLIMGNFDKDNKLPLLISYEFFPLTKIWPPLYSATYGFDDIEVIPLDTGECKEAKEVKPATGDAFSRPAIPDTSFLIENIHFGFDSFEPTGEFTGQLLFIRQLLNNNPLLVVKVSGYTDRVGTEDYNYSLSLKRAAAVGQQLSALGAPCHKIYLAAYGSNYPEQDTKNKSAANRRVEINISRLEGLNNKNLISYCDEIK